MHIPHVDCQGFINCSTPEHVYILGLIWADGHVLDKPIKHDYRVALKFHMDDVPDIVPVFLRTGPWASYPTRNGDTTQWQLTTNNKPWVRFLVEHDYRIKSGASPDKILSHIPESLRHYWWRGYFDGDGHVSPVTYPSITVDFASCFDQDWRFIHELGKHLSLEFGVRKQATKYGNSSHAYLCSKHDCFTFLEYIYQGAKVDGIGLRRKLNRCRENLLAYKPHPTQYISFYQNRFHVEMRGDGIRIRKNGCHTMEEALEVRQQIYDSLTSDQRKRVLFAYDNII